MKKVKILTLSFLLLLLILNCTTDQTEGKDLIKNALEKKGPVLIDGKKFLIGFSQSLPWLKESGNEETFIPSDDEKKNETTMKIYNYSNIENWKYGFMIGVPYDNSHSSIFCAFMLTTSSNESYEQWKFTNFLPYDVDSNKNYYNVLFKENEDKKTNHKNMYETLMSKAIYMKLSFHQDPENHSMKADIVAFFKIDTFSKMIEAYYQNDKWHLMGIELERRMTSDDLERRRDPQLLISPQVYYELVKLIHKDSAFKEKVQNIEEVIPLPNITH